MALTLRGITEGLFKNGYAWSGHPAKDKALDWAKTCVVAPQGATTSAENSLAIPVTHSHVSKTIGSDAEALTLANGTVAGQILTIECTTAGGGLGTLTPVTSTGFVTIAFLVLGDAATLQWVDDTVGWIVIGSFGAAADGGPVIALS